jgi:hypothetical protein
MTFERLKFLLEAWPRIFQIVRELWMILSKTEQENVDAYLLEVGQSLREIRGAKSKHERIEASRKLSDLMSRF